LRKDANKGSSSNINTGKRFSKDAKNYEKIFRAGEKVDRSNGKAYRAIFLVKREAEAAVDKLVSQY
jgi:hypothetical protein